MVLLHTNVYAVFSKVYIALLFRGGFRGGGGGPGRQPPSRPPPEIHLELNKPWINGYLARQVRHEPILGHT